MYPTVNRFCAPVLCALVTAAAQQAPAQDISIGGFIPLVGIGLTDEFKSGSGLEATFFLADPEDSVVGTPLGQDPLDGNLPYYDLALLDTGAATHILTPKAAGPSGFDIDGNNFDGTNVQTIGGATGQLDLSINDPLAFFSAGLKGSTASGQSLQLDTGALRGQSSVATLSAPAEWDLPNIVGLPLAAQHAISIRNDQPQIFQYDGRTVRTPQVDYIDLGTGDQQGITRRTNLKLQPGIGFIQGPIYVQDVTGILTGQPFHENPLSPSVIENGALMLEVDMSNAGQGFQDKEFLFDTGADFTVISQLTAARLGIDAILDTPDFILEVEGSSGVQGGIPGFFIEELNLDTFGGSFRLQNVPVAVLDVTNPTNPGNTIDGIIGMHLFNGRNLVIDANPSIGQGGAGPSLYISDSVTNSAVWGTDASVGFWQTAENWQANSVPDQLSDVLIKSVGSGSSIQSVVSFGVSAYTLRVEGNEHHNISLNTESGDITVFGEVRIEEGGRIWINTGRKLDAQFINMYGGELIGNGEIFVGTGPISNAVRNLGGTINPFGNGLDARGTLSITGDVSNLSGGTLEFDIAPSGIDLLDVSRFAFLAGTLEVNVLSGVDLSVGNMFTIINTGEGVFGEFDNLILPAGFLWDVSYNTNDVVLEIIGLGLAGDFSGDGIVDARDYTVWRDGLGTTYTQADYLVWKNNYGSAVGSGSESQLSSVPEPTGLLLVVSFLVTLSPNLRWGLGRAP